MSSIPTYTVRRGSPNDLLSFIKLDQVDFELIQKISLERKFNQKSNRIDAYFYSLDGRLLSYKEDVKTYSVIGESTGITEISDIELNPKQDILNAGYIYGDVNVLYNFVNNPYTAANYSPKFFIESVSSDRTEIRALSNEVNSTNIARITPNLKAKVDESTYFEELRINFGNNVNPIVINIDNVDYREEQAVILKLYKPLSNNITVKSKFAIEELVADSVLYQVTTQTIVQTEETKVNLKGPNFNIQTNYDSGINTEFFDYDTLLGSFNNNSAKELFSLVNEKSAKISINYTDFNDFIYLSSATERLQNFYYKVSLVENYTNQIENKIDIKVFENKIENIISNFDHYDRYLYYETGSWAWPKSSSTRPYELFSTGSIQVQNWYQNILLSASNYDNTNLDRLINTIPSFIREDSSNEPYLVFVDMIGQHFDNIWIYSKAITDKYDADNRLDFGVSRDLVKDVVENFGIKIYNTNQSFTTLFEAFIGEFYNTGSESYTTNVVEVNDTDVISKEKYQQEIYKRIYHNLPLLLKSKGTERGLRALINSYGIPSTTLKIKTFGGEPLDSTTYYGGDVELTSSLDKIRITDSDLVVSGSTLSYNTSVVKKGKDYSKDFSTVEIGFSPTEDVNNYIISHPSMSTFDIDDYIGDPRTAYDKNYRSLLEKSDVVYTSGSKFIEPYNVKDFVRLIKFFDNSFFRTVRDFVPARVNLNTGIVIKPNILDRSKIKQVEANWSNQSLNIYKHSNTELEFTGSDYNLNFAFEAEIPVGEITGGNALETTYTSSYEEDFSSPAGSVVKLDKNNHNEPFYNGEFKGTVILVQDGEVGKDNPFKSLSPGGSYVNVDTLNLFFDPAVNQGVTDVTVKYSNSDYAALINNVEKPGPTISNYSYEGSRLTGSYGPIQPSFASFETIEGYIYDKETEDRVIEQLVNSDNRPPTQIKYYTVSRPTRESFFRQLGQNSRIITPELLFPGFIGEYELDVILQTRVNTENGREFLYSTGSSDVIELTVKDDSNNEMSASVWTQTNYVSFSATAYFPDIYTSSIDGYPPQGYNTANLEKTVKLINDYTLESPTLAPSNETGSTILRQTNGSVEQTKLDLYYYEDGIQTVDISQYGLYYVSEADATYTKVNVINRNNINNGTVLYAISASNGGGYTENLNYNNVGEGENYVIKDQINVIDPYDFYTSSLFVDERLVFNATPNFLVSSSDESQAVDTQNIKFTYFIPLISELTQDYTFAKTYLFTEENTKYVPIANKKVVIRDANVLAKTDPYGKIETSVADIIVKQEEELASITLQPVVPPTTPIPVSNEYKVIHLTEISSSNREEICNVDILQDDSNDNIEFYIYGIEDGTRVEDILVENSNTGKYIYTINSFEPLHYTTPTKASGEGDTTTVSSEVQADSQFFETTNNTNSEENNIEINWGIADLTDLPTDTYKLNVRFNDEFISSFEHLAEGVDANSNLKIELQIKRDGVPVDNFNTILFDSNVVGTHESYQMIDGIQLYQSRKNTISKPNFSNNVYSFDYEYLSGSNGLNPYFTGSLIISSSVSISSTNIASSSFNSSDTTYNLLASSSITVDKHGIESWYSSSLFTGSFDGGDSWWGMTDNRDISSSKYQMRISKDGEITQLRQCIPPPETTEPPPTTTPEGGGGVGGVNNQIIDNE